MKNISKELMGASAIPIILSILQKGDNYGYEIMQQLKQLSDGKIIWKEGSLYPVLKKLEQSGMIESYWNTSDFDRPRKYYRLLNAGISVLEKQQNDWTMMNSILTKLWNLKPDSI